MLLLPGAAKANEPLEPPAYSYHGSRLLLQILTPDGGRTVIHWRACNAQGLPIGRPRALKVELAGGRNRIELQVGDAGGHQLSYTLGKQAYHLRANRGVWYIPASPLRIDKTIHTRSRSREPVISSDTYLAGGMVAYVRSGDKLTPLEVGRTLGYDADLGVRLTPRHALTIVARGTGGPVTLTISQKVSKKVTQYWDYALVLTPEFARYVVPLTLLHPRVRPARPLRSIYTVSLRTTTPAAERSLIEIDQISLTRQPARLRQARRTPAGMAISVQRGTRPASVELWWSGLRGAPQRWPLIRKSTALISSPEARRYWICYVLPDGGHGCDPPDAPKTTYAMLPPRGMNVLVDAFEYQAPINAFREPTTIFAASVPLQENMVVERQPGSVLIRYHPTSDQDYAGYLTPLPTPLPETPASVELTIRGKVPSAAVKIGLRDQRGLEPRVRLSGYLPRLGSKWQTVLIPFEAWRAALAGFKGSPRELQQLRSLSITMGVSSTPATHEIELKRIQLAPARVPLAIARFDGEPAEETALGGGLLMESRLGVRLEGRRESKGKIGRGLAIDITSEQGKGYGVLTLGLGQVDTRRYQSLSFWVRGETPHSSAVLLLSDGKKRAKYEFGAAEKISPRWEKVTIPLSSFAGTIDRANVRQLIFAWESAYAYREILVFDEFYLE